MVEYLDVFASLALLAFSVSVLLSGMFAAYFGAGKSRKVGLGLQLVGLLGFLVFFAATYGFPAGAQQWTGADVLTGIVGVAGAMVGASVATAIFFVAILRA